MRESNVQNNSERRTLAPGMRRVIGTIESAIAIAACGFGTNAIFAVSAHPDDWINVLFGKLWLVTGVALLIGGLGLYRSVKAGLYAQVPLAAWLTYLVGTIWMTGHVPDL